MSSGELNYPRFQDDPEMAKLQLPLRKGHTITKAKIPMQNKFLERELSGVFSENYSHEAAESTIMDPRGDSVHTWNKIFFAACLTSLFVDPLFFLLPRASPDMCIHVSKPLEIALTIIRSSADMFYIANIYVRFQTAYVAPSSRVFGRGELVVDRSKIALRYLHKDFWLDIPAALPIPQILIWAVMPSLKGPSILSKRGLIRVGIVIQYFLRLYLIFPLASKINKATGVVLEAAWAGAGYNLMLYMLASHILGCLWYILAIERQEDCWSRACAPEHRDCYSSFLDCNTVNGPGRESWFKSSNVSSLCDPRSGLYDYGIYAKAVTSGVTSSSFLTKFYYCLWWAMRNLNCFGQELSPGTYIGEISYSMILGVLALVLFGLLIANMQTYLQSNNARLEQWRVLKTDTERWMHHRHLPDEIRHCIRRHYEHKWCATRGVDEEAILQSLPTDLRRVIKRHLCLDLVRKVRLFELMDEHMLDAICEKLKPRLYDGGTCLLRERDPVNDMLFIIRGRLNSYTTDGGRTDFFNSSVIGPGDFCGEELVTWALYPPSNSGVILPPSTRTVIALTEVEAFALVAEDLKFVESQFRRLNTKQLRQAFRYHSHHWRTWAACSIQAAWFRYKKRKEAEELRRMKGESEEPLEQTVPTLLRVASEFTMYAAKLAASTRRGGAKPQEPDFTAER